MNKDERKRAMEIIFAGTEKVNERIESCWKHGLLTSAEQEAIYKDNYETMKKLLLLLAQKKKERKKHMIENRVNQNKAKKTAAQFMIDRAKARRQRNR